MPKQEFNFGFFLVLVLMLIAGAVSWGLYFRTYSQKDALNIHHFPYEIGDWKGQELKISEEDYAVLETRNAFTRKYIDGKGRMVYLFIVYSQDNRKVSHPPEICYTGSGATILSSKNAQIKIPAGSVIRANKLLLEQEHMAQILYYWFKVGDTYTPSYWKQQILFSLKGLLGRPSSTALIRVSGVLERNDEVGDLASRNIEDFSRAIVPLLPKYLP